MKKVIFMIATLCLTMSSFAGNGNIGSVGEGGLSKSCQQKILKKLKTKTIRGDVYLDAKMPKLDHGSANYSPFVGPVCKGDENIREVSSGKNKHIIEVRVKPHAGYNEKGLRVSCDSDEINRMPVLTLQVSDETWESCFVVLKQIKAEFNLND